MDQELESRAVKNSAIEPGPSGQPLFEALDIQVVKLERAVALGAMVAALLGMFLTVYLWVFVAPVLGKPLTLFCGSLIVWFGLSRFLLSREVGVSVLRLVNPMIEASVPGTILLIDTLVMGSPWALDSSLAHLIYTLPVVLAVLRLRALVPLLVGLMGAAQYALILGFLILPGIPEGLLASGSVDPKLLYLRPLWIALVGLTGALISVALRSAARRAHGVVRARDLFGKYRMGEKLASGGMGEVYQATYCPEGGFERKVAVKRIHAHLAQQKKFVDAFRAEAELSARLNHPNIVQVLDFGVVEDTFFLSMEFVDGWSLSEILRMCRASGMHIPGRLVASLLRDICSALAFAHREAIGNDGKPLHVIHRDLSPSNVMVTRGGQAKVTDFGVAKVTGTKGYTMTTTLAGKAPYMSPEQVRGEAIDERSDLFAAGTVAWEMLTIRRLFWHETDVGSLRAILKHDVTPPSTMRDDLRGTGWDTFVLRALARDPERRYQAACTMVDDLDKMLADQGLPAPAEFPAFMGSLTEADRADDRMTFSLTEPAEDRGATRKDIPG